MRVGIVGCGYVADYYVSTLGGHPGLALAGVADRSEERLRRFCAHHGVMPYSSLGRMLEDPSVDIIVNLTNPESHVDVTRAALEAGKHVYSEKPLALRQRDAEALLELAASRGLGLASAPCGVLGETAQTLWKVLRDGRIGRPLLVYAELDDGPKYFPEYRPRISASGALWPHNDEFRTGCILEHAGYYLSWLVTFFGPAQAVTAFTTCIDRNKSADIPASEHGPDFSVACIEFASGTLARLTCSVLAEPNRALRIIGESGTVWAEDCWDYAAPVRLLETPRPRGTAPTLVAPVRGSSIGGVQKLRHPMDFARGIAELAESVQSGRASRLSGAFTLHVNELALAINEAGRMGAPVRLSTRFDSMAPMPWAL